jgi:hypothetical protein
MIINRIKQILDYHFSYYLATIAIFTIGYISQFNHIIKNTYLISSQSFVQIILTMLSLTIIFILIWKKFNFFYMSSKIYYLSIYPPILLISLINQFKNDNKEKFEQTMIPLGFQIMNVIIWFFSGILLVLLIFIILFDTLAGFLFVISLISIGLILLIPGYIISFISIRKMILTNNYENRGETDNININKWDYYLLINLFCYIILMILLT